MRPPEMRIRRVYDSPSPEDGKRVLVDRLWPRGLSKDRAAVDIWLKEIAPTDGLRRWFSHDREKWDEFRKRYRAELAENGKVVNMLLDLAKSGPLALLYSTSSADINNAVVLLEYMEDLMKKG
jgi:uncharacterized protein YeaO (DUF488 family)